MEIIKLKNKFFINYYEDNKRAYLRHMCNNSRAGLVYGYFCRHGICPECGKKVSKSILAYIKLLQLGLKIK